MPSTLRYLLIINGVRYIALFVQSFPRTIRDDTEFRRVDRPSGGVSSLLRGRGPRRSASNTASAERERMPGAGLPRLPRRECVLVNLY